MNKETPSFDRITVLEITGNAVVGGMESYVARLVEHLPAQRFRVLALCPFESGFTARLRRLGAEVYIARVDDDPRWRSIQFAASLVRNCGVDVIHAHLANAHVLGGIVSRLTGIPALATVHGRLVPLLDLEAHFAAGTHMSVVCQPAYLQALGVGVRRDRLHLVPNGVDEHAFRPEADVRYLHKALGLPPDTVLVGQVGRLAPEKAPEDFLAMALSVHQRLPDVHFVFVGDGPLRARAVEGAAALGIAHRVHFAGCHDDMPAVYASLSVVVFSSHTEGMPLALMEAMSCGRAIVATNVGSVAEMIEAGRSGWLAEPELPQTLAEGVLRLLENRPLTEAMGSAARARAVELFPLRRSIDAVGNLLLSLVREHRRDRARLPAAAPLKSPARQGRLGNQVA